MSLAVGATLGPSAYWYLARGTGAVALVLLTASVVIGILGSVRFVAERWPRFAIDAVHRDVSLLVIVVLVIHIVTSVLDGFAPITLLDGVIPFNSPYRPLWLGLGTLSFDLLVAIAVTSLVRRRLGYRAWRAVHWLAYASWPVAVLHGLGTGSDTTQWWMLALTVVCIVAVLVAVWLRIGYVDAAHAGLRAPATALAVITPIGLMIFALAGPLQSGWAKRAGTPASLLGHATRAPSSSTSGGSGGSGSGAGASSISGPFTGNLSGSVRESAAPGGAVVDLTTNVSGQVRGRFRVQDRRSADRPGPVDDREPGRPRARRGCLRSSRERSTICAAPRSPPGSPTARARSSICTPCSRSTTRAIPSPGPFQVRPGSRDR